MATPPPKKLLTLEDIPGAPKWVEPLLGGINGALKPTAEALSQALTFRENFAGEVKTVTLTPPDDWVPVSGAALGSGWSTGIGGTSPRLLSYRKTGDGTVQVRGRVDYPTGAPATAATIIAFPDVGWLPDRREVFDCFASDGVNYMPATISAFGSALAWELGGSRNLSLSGDVWWTASDRTPPRWSSPVDVKLGTPQKPFPGRPGSVIILSAQQANNPTAPAVVTGWDITPINLERQKSAPGVRIHRVWGLVPGVAYSLTLLILPE